MDTSTLRCFPNGAFRSGQILAVLICFLLVGCSHDRPSIVFTQIPVASLGGPNTSGVLAGKVTGSKPGDRIVLYARSGNQWWIQPSLAAPFTQIRQDATWTATIHLGVEYGAVLVRGEYRTDAVISALPDLEGHTVAKASAPATMTPTARTNLPPKTLHFSGYDWEVRTVAGPSGGLAHSYVPDNVWLDSKGSMHLRISREDKQWFCAEVHTARSLGYGSYKFVLRDVGHLEPAAMLGLLTRDDDSKDEKHTEMDIHVSRWGRPESKNGEYVIQPYHIPSNVYRFEIPGGTLTTGFRWSPGIASFSTTLGADQTGKQIAAWTFTTGIPTPTGERLYINLCEFGYPRIPLQHGAEVVVDRFQFLP
jgi:hypothetical protein